MFFRRLIRTQSHLLFHAPIQEVVQPGPGDEVVCTAISVDTIGQQRALADSLVQLNPDNRLYLADIEKDRITGLVISKNGKPVHYGFVFKSNKTACLLGLPACAALIGNSFTVPQYRGQGLQARSVRARADIALLNGFTAVAAETHPDNHASQRGLTKSGLKLQGRVDLLVLLSCFVVRWRRPAGIPLLGFCL